MLDYKILTTDYGVSYGSVTLKSLQNDNTPELDLLVREAIQNSSDASLNEEGDSYTVNFKTGEFIPEQLNLFMTGAENKLNTMFPSDRAEFLEIRDTNTSGLTGPIKISDLEKDDHGNFFKLIYDTGKKQNITLAGGNWGFGKSVYYRVGIGIVIFYSRIKVSDAYEDRLIVTLIEDESKTDSNGRDATILNSLEEQSAGKAWWGIQEGDELLPLRNQEIIQDVLDVFDIKQFREGETGTSIIIPYIDTEKLLDGIIPVEDNTDDESRSAFKGTYTSDISSYLKLAIQRWYAPKIHNLKLKEMGSKWLRVYVNNDPINKDRMIPFFRLVQELYTTALAKTLKKEYESKEYSRIETFDINIRSYFDSGMRAGCVSVIRISKAEIKGFQSGMDPYDYIGKFGNEAGINEPIMMYARDPGMVIDYAIAGPWVKHLIPPDNSEEYLLGFFVPETKKTIREDFELKDYAGMQLGEYLRECEASDHMGWNDPVKMQIVQRIQKNIINQINNQSKNKSAIGIDATASKLSNKLGRTLLPRIGYGKARKPGSSSESGSSGGGAKLSNIYFDLHFSSLKQNEIKLDFTLRLMHSKKSATLSMMIASEAGWVDAASWHDEIGTTFPIQIISCYINTVSSSISKDPYFINKVCNKENPEINTDAILVSLNSETEDSVNTQVRILSHIQNPEINGEIILQSDDKKYQFNLRAE